MRGLKGDDELLQDGKPQIAFIGRSNVGKSTLMNSLTNSSKLARTSKTPGRTQEINVFLINNSYYFMDLPGYGYARAKGQIREELNDLIAWYIFDSNYDPKVVLLIDAEIGPTDGDLSMLSELESAGKDIVIVLNKVDKIKKSQYKNQIDKLKEKFAGHKVIPYSSKAKIGIEELTNELLEEV